MSGRGGRAVKQEEIKGDDEDEEEGSDEGEEAGEAEEEVETATEEGTNEKERTGGEKGRGRPASSDWRGGVGGVVRETSVATRGEQGGGNEKDGD
jgi:hypothetical protein